MLGCHALTHSWVLASSRYKANGKETEYMSIGNIHRPLPVKSATLALHDAWNGHSRTCRHSRYYPGRQLFHVTVLCFRVE